MISDPRLTLARPDLAADHLRDQIDAPRYAKGQIMQICTPTAPLFAAPRADGPLQSEFLLGEEVLVVEQTEEGWSWGQNLSDGYVGYLTSDALTSDVQAVTHQISALRSFVYAAATIKLQPLQVLSFGAKLAITDTQDQFSRLATGGYIFSSDLTPLTDGSQNKDLQDPAAFAAYFLHSPYLWGGRSSLGVDCSGLIQLALQACGIKAPRDSDQQERALGHEIADTNSLHRNDLVFWKGHVGLMLDQEHLLHASGHHMHVVIEPLAEARSRILQKTGHDLTSCKRLVF